MTRRAGLWQDTVSDVLHRTDYVVSHENGKALEPFGVTMYQAKALIFIAEHEQEMTVNQRAIERYTRLSNPGVTKLIGGLVRMGYLERTQDPSDARSYVLKTTPEGQAQCEVFRRVVAETDQRVTANLTEGEKASLVALLNKLSSFS